jgi:Mat/Ecp fimbriae outer membrane usher protein
MPRPWMLAGTCLTAQATLSAGIAHGQGAPSPQIITGMPAGFADLNQTQRIVVDGYFGGVRIGQFEVDADPSSVRFAHPDRLAAAIPNIADSAAVAAALSGSLPSNARYLCNPSEAPCERPQPDIATIVYDTTRFRIDLYVHPRFLKIRANETDRFLRPFSETTSLVDTIGLAMAGGDGSPLSYNIRNRLLAGIGSGRLVSEASLASIRGLNVDTLAVQLDRPNIRHSAGLFYVPGPDLVGRRRILGIGTTSQFDTRADRQALNGNPLVVFLAQRSRVDIYVQGRLVSSRTFDAGNQQLDTSSLPDGSYPVEIRIQEAGGAARTEQRFFTKSAMLAPTGRTIFYANAGLLAVERDGSPLAIARIPLVTAGAAGRLGTHLAWEGAVMATDRKTLVQLGGTVLTSFLQARIAVLGSSARDIGMMAQISATGASPLSYNLDLRRLHSRDQQPLIPLDDYVATPFPLGSAEAQRLGVGASSYTQLIGNIAYHFGAAQIGASGYYRQDSGRELNYAFGPTLRWTLLQRGRMQLAFNGSYAETNRGRSIAFRLQVQLLGGRSSWSASAGAQTDGNGDGRSLGQVAEFSGSIQRSKVLGGDFSANASLQHGSAGDVLQATAEERSPVGYAALSLVDRLTGAGSGRQYGLTAQTSLGLGHGAVRFGAYDQNDGLLSIGVRGAVGDARFEVLVDDAPRGTIRAGQNLTLSVTPYRRYTVRVRAIGSQLVAIDMGNRTVDIYPGTFAPLEWKATSVLAMFGRLIDIDGKPIANADITADDAVAATDDNGYFQLQAAHDARIVVNRANGGTCSARLAARRSPKGYTPLGDILCAP